MIRSEVILAIAAPLVLLASGSASVCAQEKSAPFDRSRLEFKPGDAETALGLAIELTRIGDLQTAASVLEPFAEGERIRRELGRIEALEAFRNDLLSSKLGKAVRLNEEAEISKIRSITDGKVELTSKAGEVIVPLTSIGAAELLSIQGRRKISGKSAWVGDYLQLLLGSAELERSARGDDALMADAPSYAELRRVGSAARRLQALTELEAPAQALTHVEGLGELRDVPIVAERLTTLREYASSLLGASFDPSSPEALGIRGQATQKGEGRLALTYDFREAAQAQDFAPDPDWFSANRRRLLGKGKEVPVVFEVQGGGLEMKGAGCYRHALTFEAPIRVSYRLIYHEVTDDPNPYFMLGMVAQPDESHLGFENVTRFYSMNRKTAVQRVRSLDTNFIAGNLYSIEIEHPGGDKAKVKIDTNWREVETQGLTRGGLVLFFQAVHGVRLEQLEIEGKPVIDEATKQQWIDQRLAKLGLDPGE